MSPRNIGTGRRFRGVEQYLLRDEFATALAAGSVHNTSCEPGPGTRKLVELAVPVVSISGGRLVFGAPDAAAWKPLFYIDAVTRTPGRLVVGNVRPVNNNRYHHFGFSSGILEGSVGDIFYTNTTSVQHRSGTLAITFSSTGLTGGTDYYSIIALRSTGSYCFVKESGLWILKSVVGTGGGSTATLYPSYSALTATSTMSCDYLRNPATLWLPVPLLSDGFGGTWPTSDGLGHLEGVAGGLGAGGSNLSWVDSIGTWGIAGGVASASALVGGVAIATVELNRADVWCSCNLIRSAGNVGVVVRYIDSSNYVYAYHDGTNVKLVEVVATVATERGTAAKAYSASARLIVDVSGTTVRVYYNEAFQFAYASLNAIFTTATKVGLYTTDTGNTFNDAVAYAKGTGGEYAILDRF